MKLRLIFTLIIMFLCTSCKTIKDFPQSNYPPYYNSINMEYNGKNYSQHGKILDNLPEGFELVSNDITKKMFKNQANLYINDNTPFYVYVGYSVNGETEYHQWRRSEGGTFKVCYNDCIYTCEGSVNRYDLPESLTQAGYILGCTQNKTPTQQLFADTDAVLGLNVYETVDTKTLYVEVWAETEYKVLKISEHI